ncbi:glycosyltransferase family 2 protein [Flavobacterium ponti]|uniref:Glycosyltransferase family 2 protein n=1 Tax=Flavobacterium ponti TaxID=665133 RepID=A0ABV9P4H5_9FLAO
MISIIMPVYNVEKYIAKSIQSVLNQTYQDFELLVIIDGSPDNSKQIAETFNDERITIYEKSNGGLSDARNYGLKRAKGEFVYFLDSDDWIEPTLLQDTICVFDKKEIDLVIFGYFLDNEDLEGNLISTKEISTKDIQFDKDLNNLDLDEKTLNILGYAWNKLYRISFLKNNNIIFDKGVSLVEDILFNSKVYKNSNTLTFINKRLYHYINRPSESLIKTFHKNSFELYLEKSNSIESFLDSWNISNDKKNKILASVIVSGIRYCVNNLFAFKNDLNEGQKIAYIKMMLHNADTQKFIKSYDAISSFDKLYKKIISNKAVFLLYLLCKIKK